MWLPPAISIAFWIPAFYAESRSLYADVSVFPSKWPYFYSDPLLWVRTLVRRPVHPLGERKTRGKGWIWMGEFSQVCAMRFWREIFTAPSPILSPTPTLVPGSTIYLGFELHGVPWSTTYPAVNPTCDVRNGFLWLAKWVRPFSRPWVDLKWWVRLVPPCPSFRQPWGQTKKNVSVDCCKPAHVFPS